MKRFRCEVCGLLLVPENDRCLGCGCRLSFLPDRMRMASWPAQVPADGLLLADGGRYRACANTDAHAVCNWAVRVDDDNELCWACRATPVIPDLTVPDNHRRWHRLEVAKRRVLIGLLSLGLLRLGPAAAALEPPLRFQFLGGAPAAEAGSRGPVATGHAQGLITVDIAEADDDERERRRVELNEPYRTLVGHLRHEIGHFYWDQAVRPSRRRLEAFRARFGDERADYAAALQAYYRDGPAPDWRERCVSAYASMHPWEDWAETFAHYLHMMDSLETASESGLWVRSRRSREPRFAPIGTRAERSPGFDCLIERWRSLTYVLNDLTRGLGLADAYPFVLPQPAVDKLALVHRTLAAYARQGLARSPGPLLAPEPSTLLPDRNRAGP